MTRTGQGRGQGQGQRHGQHESHGQEQKQGQRRLRQKNSDETSSDTCSVESWASVFGPRPTAEEMEETKEAKKKVTADRKARAQQRRAAKRRLTE